MDIVRVKRQLHQKANFVTLPIRYKFLLLIFLVSILITLMPHGVSAAFLVHQDYRPILVFDTTTFNHLDYMVQISQEATDRFYLQQMQQQVYRQVQLSQKVQEYLQTYGSPLADYAPTLVTMRNWKTIVALANAESSLCRRYPVDKANCWGVGGSNLWDMGENLGQGIISMNHFLNKYPKGQVKYSQMSFERMNGLYKQPPADHWVYNNQKVYNDLLALENSL